jgi:hypothetical protein
MHDNFIVGVVSLITGSSTFLQTTSAGSLPLPLGALISAFSMLAAALIAWGMFKKSSEHHANEIKLLRQSLGNIAEEVSDVGQRVARIEGRLEGLATLLKNYI